MVGTNREDQSAVGYQRLTERLREAIEQQPRKMTQQLAREFGVPELEVIRAFPDDRATELAITGWEDIIRRIEALGAVRVLVSNEAATIEVVGQFGGFSTTGEFFNVQSGSLDLHIRWRELASAFAVQKPGHTDGLATYSIQFFNRTAPLRSRSSLILARFSHQWGCGCYACYGTSSKRLQKWLRPGKAQPPRSGRRNHTARLLV